MTRQQLIDTIRAKQTYLCVGLDTDITKIPRHLLSQPDPVFAFNKQVIDATKDYCVAYKVNTAFYEAVGLTGWDALEKTADYIPTTHFKIADAKRGDIGNTSSQYAKAFFETLQFDAVTVAPYMGEDSIRPFLEYPGKWTIVLGLTSNPGSKDFELKQSGDSLLYENVIKKAAEWGNPGNLMFVIGATQSDFFAKVRALVPDHFFLVPGVGAQGGSITDISTNALNKDVGLLVNASRTIIYASDKADFAAAAAKVAQQYQEEMELFLS